MTQPHVSAVLPSATHSIEGLSGSGYFEDKKDLFILQHSSSQTLKTGGAQVYINLCTYTGCNRRNGPDFGRMFLMLNYTDITQNTYIQS